MDFCENEWSSLPCYTGIGQMKVACCYHPSLLSTSLMLFKTMPQSLKMLIIHLFDGQKEDCCRCLSSILFLLLVCKEASQCSKSSNKNPESQEPNITIVISWMSVHQQQDIFYLWWIGERAPCHKKSRLLFILLFSSIIVKHFSTSPPTNRHHKEEGHSPHILHKREISFHKANTT